MQPKIKLALVALCIGLTRAGRPVVITSGNVQLAPTRRRSSGHFGSPGMSRRDLQKKAEAERKQYLKDALAKQKAKHAKILKRLDECKNSGLHDIYHPGQTVTVFDNELKQSSAKITRVTPRVLRASDGKYQKVQEYECLVETKEGDTDAPQIDGIRIFPQTNGYKMNPLYAYNFKLPDVKRVHRERHAFILRRINECKNAGDYSVYFPNTKVTLCGLSDQLKQFNGCFGKITFARKKSLVKNVQVWEYTCFVKMKTVGEIPKIDKIDRYKISKISKPEEGYNITLYAYNLRNWIYPTHGDMVKLRGLSSKPEFNGMLAEVISSFIDRFAVVINGTNTPMVVPARNVEYHNIFAGKWRSCKIQWNKFPYFTNRDGLFVKDGDTGKCYEFFLLHRCWNSADPNYQAELTKFDIFWETNMGRGVYFQVPKSEIPANAMRTSDSLLQIRSACAGRVPLSELQPYRPPRRDPGPCVRPPPVPTQQKQDVRYGERRPWMLMT